MKFLHRFGIFLQDLFIKSNSFIKPEIIHNIEKHSAIKKALFYKYLEAVPGDYLEFGVYEGTSIKAAALAWRKISKSPVKFFGFDSFEGMRPEPKDQHPFYTKFDFSTDFNIIRKRFRYIPEVRLVKGYFDKTLGQSPSDYGIKKASVVLVDCDLYSSAQQVFSFLKGLVSPGTILILDDYFNYLGGKKKGVRAAFNEFIKKNHISTEEIMKYGVGGAVFLVTEVKKD